jgi:homogentisate 1,2-dioxygenase
MAIAPNTTFVSGAILTAAQQNAFAFGTMAYSSNNSSNVLGITTITTTFTMSSFTAIANRNYKITYFEPVMFCSSGSGEGTLTIKNGATTLATTILTLNVNNSAGAVLQTITTFTAGATTLTTALTYTTGTGTMTAGRNATRVAFALVEDIGPA